MKKNHCFVVIMLIVMVLCSCSGGDYQKVIPAEATLVVRADLKSLAAKSDFQHSKTMDFLNEALMAATESHGSEKMKEYLENPMKIGLDFSVPSYFFMVGDETLGATMKVFDEDDVENFLLLLQQQGIATKPVEKDGLMCGTLLGDVHYAYDASSLLFLSSSKGKGMVSRLLNELMNLEERDCFINTPAYSRMSVENGDVVFTASMPLSFDTKTFDMMASLTFENGRALCKTKMWGRTDKAQALIDEANANFSHINGKYVESVSNDLLFWGVANVKGGWLLDKMKEDKSAKEFLFLLERAVDVEQMLRAVDGDVAIELQMNAANVMSSPEFIVYAELKNSDFLADVDYWKESMKAYGISMQDEGENQYLLAGEGKYRFGVQDKNLYVASESASSIVADENPLTAYTENIKNSKLFVYVNMDKMNHKDFVKGLNWLQVVEEFNPFEKAVISMPSWGEMNLVIEMKNKKENFLKQIL